MHIYVNRSCYQKSREGAGKVPEEDRRSAGVAENIKSLLVNSMEKWNVMLFSGNSELGEVEIKPGIF